ncbi:MAG: hypothetical protein NTW96_10895 [Planctomycetia bacterium]|nr:hypothetical protein [Planctomycetia bacterium]
MTGCCPVARRFRVLIAPVFALLIATVGLGMASAQSPDLKLPGPMAEKTADLPQAAAAETDKGGSTAEPPAVGDPMAAGIVALLPDEINNGFKRRGIESNFARFRAYAAEKLDSTAGARLTSEVTGNCRLSWYDHMLRNPLAATAEAEEFTRTLHAAILGDHEGLDRALAIAGEKLDLGSNSPRTFAEVASPDEALESVKQALTEAQAAYAETLAPLTPGEIDRLARGLYSLLTRNGNVGHTLSDRSGGRQMCDLLEKVDRRAMLSAVGTVVKRIATPSGDIIIGGPGKNTYQLDAMADVNVVIDLGGDDTYYEGTCSVERPVLVVIDLGGNDTYRGKKPGIQGAAVLGISMLLDRAGNDTYEANDVAQGSCLGGVGILIDYAGNDAYLGVRRVQGQAIGGLGILIDRAGDDRYHAAMWAQGFGGPLGFGLLDDLDGADEYYVGGLYPDSYEETPGYEGWGQGIGAGIRQVADGGLGVILDGGGDDVYEYDYISHGGGYWLGMGFARDFGGNDQRLGATRQAFNGSARTERRFQRFSNGFGCHYALGFLFDDAGDDTYDGTIMGLGFAWDVSVGVLCDFAGKDKYLATGGGTQGNGAQAGLGILFDYAGDDVYSGYGQGRASSSISYHDLPQCGGNFSFVIDYGGTDKYGCGAQNNSYIERGSAGGFLIDRPKREEIGANAAAQKGTPANVAGP